MITGRQIREARALLGMTPSRLAIRARIITQATLIRAKAVHDEPMITTTQANAIQQALDRAGVEFIPENGGGASVRLRKVGQTL